MNIIAHKKCQEVLNSYTVGKEPTIDTRYVRAKEKDAANLFFTYKVQTLRGLQENKYYRTFENSFSRCKSCFDEFENVSLTDFDRTDADTYRESMKKEEEYKQKILKK